MTWTVHRSAIRSALTRLGWRPAYVDGRVFWYRGTYTMVLSEWRDAAAKHAARHEHEQYMAIYKT